MNRLSPRNVKVTMSDILLAKPSLPKGFIDLSVGEPHVVRESLFQAFDMKDWRLPTPDHCWEYPYANGYQPLTDLLEWKHGGKVVITNGAKQALGATFYALKKMGWNFCQEKSPHWALIPPLAQMHGIDMVHANGPSIEDKSPFLLIAPNNPDGHCETDTELLSLSKEYAAANLPLIHDAAYYTHSYVSRGHQLPKIGDVQIYSISKMLGLSNLRMGYAVCHNLEYYKLIKEYVEMTTVGVSLPSQMFTFDIMNQMRGYPTIVEKFEDNVFLALRESKKIIQKVSPEVLEIPAGYEDNPGMFGWFKVGPKADFTKAKINVIDGALFGTPGYIRTNLALPKETMLEITNRLNSVLEP